MKKKIYDLFYRYVKEIIDAYLDSDDFTYYYYKLEENGENIYVIDFELPWIMEELCEFGGGIVVGPMQCMYSIDAEEDSEEWYCEITDKLNNDIHYELLGGSEKNEFEQYVLKAVDAYFDDNLEKIKFVNGYGDTEKDNNSLYHYTSLQTCEYICNGKSLRLSSAIASNDKDELRYLLKKYDGFEDLETPDNIFKLIMEKLEKIKQENNCLISCLSERKDSLALWERYGDGCEGVCIQFDKQKLTEWLKTQSEELEKKSGNNLILLKKPEKVNYYSQPNIIYFYEFFKETMGCESDDLEFNKKIALQKHIGFEDEQEERIVMLYKKADENKLNEMLIDTIKYDKEKKCAFLSLPEECITAIWVGPLVSEKSYNKIEKIALENGITTIKKSIIPYSKRQKNA